MIMQSKKRTVKRRFSK